MHPILDVRLAIVANGYVPIPVLGKRPLADEWQKTANVSRAMLESWDRDYPNASNTGILT